MSKSDISDFSRINLLDDPDTIQNKIKKAKTDSFEIMGQECIGDDGNIKESVLLERPEAVNLIQIYAALSNEELSEALGFLGGKEFRILKEKLIDILIAKIAPIGNEVKKMLNDKIFLHKVLEEGAEIARTEKYHEGSVPLHTLRGDIDYSTAKAETTYGICGIKVWINKGEILLKDPYASEKKQIDQGSVR